MMTMLVVLPTLIAYLGVGCIVSYYTVRVYNKYVKKQYSPSKLTNIMAVILVTTLWPMLVLGAISMLGYNNFLNLPSELSE